MDWTTVLKDLGNCRWELPKSYRYDRTFHAAWHRDRGNLLFADGHVQLLRIRQTLQPQVLWDNLRDWCPECGCASQEGWGPAEVARTLKEIDRWRYP